MRSSAVAALSLASACAVPALVGTLASDGEVPTTTLPPLPPMVVARVQARADSVDITLAPVEGALDYRVYVLPRDEDVSVAADGSVVIRDGLYRCAGDREAPLVPTDGQAQVQSGAVATVVTGPIGDHPYQRGVADATLGYVLEHPSAGYVPVYALGDPTETADTACYFHRFQASRVKRYTSADSERAALLAAGWRDDGIAFYVPAAPSAQTRSIHRLARSDGAELIVADGPELDAVAALEPERIFDVLSAQTEGAVPLMRVFYTNLCARPHDELAVGPARFAHAVHQGRFALPHLHWAGLTGPTTLVVEALDRGCPFQGNFSAQHRDALPAEGPRPAHDPWLTLAELRAASTTGEVFLNGQHDPNNRPRAIARAYVEVAPQPEPAMDWEARFDAPLEVPEVTYLQMEGGLDRLYDFPEYDVRFYAADQQTIGVAQGELWVRYAETNAATQGFFTLTPRVDAQLQDDAFIHVRMDVDQVTTERRYSQIFVTNLPIPTHESGELGWTIGLYPFGSWPAGLRMTYCDHVQWDAAGTSCDHIDAARRPDGGWAPTLPVAELAGADRSMRIELYVSSRRMYALLDGEPYGCRDLPSGLAAAGPVRVTFGDVLFNSAIDLDLEVLGQPVYAFHREHMQHETLRHFDNLGFSSGVPAPAWDETRMPCWP